VNKYKLLALDIDGTTITNDQRITEETYIWIKRAIKSGVTVMFATGRGLHRVEHLAHELQLRSPMVLLNGSEVWEGTDQLIERHFLDRDTVFKLYSISRKNNARFWGYDVKGLIGYDDWDATMLHNQWMKFTIYHSETGVLQYLKDYSVSLGTVEVAQTSISHLELSPKGRTKEAGIKTICDCLNLAMDEVMAIGDEQNDLQLLQSAGLGVAMGNATNEIKQIANVVTDTNEQDGVAKAIKQYIFEL